MRKAVVVLKKLQPVLWLAMTAGLVIPAVLYGKKVSVAVIMLLMAVQIAVWEVCHIGQGEGILNRKKSFVLSKKGGIRAGICLLGVFFAAFFLVLYKPANLYHLVYQVEGQVVRAYRLFTGKAKNPVDGAINRGNIYRTGSTELEVTVSEAPTQELYLKGFSGGIYMGNRWEEADEESVFEEAAQLLEWGRWSSMISGMYHNMQFMLNKDTFREEKPTVRDIFIRHENGDYDRTFVPYYSMKGLSSGNEEETGEGYEYQYYEQKDVQFAWDDEGISLEMAREWYHHMQEAYVEAAQRIYTQVPEELLSGLVQMVRDNPQENLEEITGFIRYALQSQASYTLTPGRIPANEDIVEYFFFESRQGYCQQFAATATLLYRLYGIPARYVSGYLLQPEDFQRQADGTWRAEVTDEAAHAWTEILLGDYGWTPIEMTPSQEGSIPVSELGFAGMEFGGQDESGDGLRETEKEQQERWQSALQESLQEFWQEKEQDRNARWTEEGYSSLFDLQKYSEFYLTAGIASFYVLFCLPVFEEYKRVKHRLELGKMNCRRIFALMMDMLHDAGYVRELEGWEEDFPEKVSREFRGISKEELQGMQKIVRRAAYGQTAPEPEEEQFVRWIYFRLEKQVFGRMEG